MVDVSAKAATERIAVAEGRVVMAKKTLDLVLKGNAKKGDVLGAARLAGIMAAKRTHELIPLCHPLALVQGRGRHRAGARCRASRCAPTVKVTGPDRRRDGGADRGVGRVPDDLRHGQGGRARHADRRHPAAREARRQVGPLPGQRTRRGLVMAACCRSPTRWRACSTDAEPLPAEHAAADRSAWPRARRRRRGAAHAAAGRTCRRWTAMRCAPASVATVPATLKLIGEVAAGHPFDGEVGDGEAARIFTGGVVPPGADTIVIQENTTRDGDTRRRQRPARRRAGTSAAPGSISSKARCCCAKGRRLTDRDLMLAAAMNHPDAAGASPAAGRGARHRRRAGAARQRRPGPARSSIPTALR